MLEIICYHSNELVFLLIICICNNEQKILNPITDMCVNIARENDV